MLPEGSDKSGNLRQCIYNEKKNQDSFRRPKYFCVGRGTIKEESIYILFLKQKQHMVKLSKKA